MSSKKYVYDFAEGKRKHAFPLGRQRRQPGGDDRSGYTCAPGVHRHHRGCIYYSANGAYAEGLTEEIEGHLRALEKLTGKTWAIRATRSCSPSAPARSSPCRA